MTRSTTMIDIPEVVRNRAVAVGADEWLADLADLVASLEVDWGIEVGSPFTEGTEAFVAPAVTADGRDAVLKVLIPRPGDHFDDPALGEITVLSLVAGDGCPALFAHDHGRHALLIERLGPSMFSLGLPLGIRQRALCDVARRVWRPAPQARLPTGAEKAEWLGKEVAALWEELDRPCTEAAIEHAQRCAANRQRAHDADRAVLVHGDVHEWNALRRGEGWALVDPDGLLAEPEYDLGIMMREDPVELLEGDPRERARRFAAWSGLDETAIWEWGVIERVSTGLLAARIDLQPVGRQMLDAADRIATSR